MMGVSATGYQNKNNNHTINFSRILFIGCEPHQACYDLSMTKNCFVKHIASNFELVFIF